MDNPRFIKIRNILVAILLLNWAVALLKIIYGYITDCYSMAADGFHSFSDGASNIIGIAGIYAALRPADKDHPYGHRKYETFAALGIAMLLFLISINLIRAAVIRFITPVVPEVNAVSFGIMIFTVFINCGVVYIERRKSRELKSDILKADAEHTRSDILVSISVIFTLLAIRAGFPIIDTIVALVIAFLIARSGVIIMKESSQVLCDRTAVVSDKIRPIVMSTKGVKECHQIRTRGSSDDVHVDLHVLVDDSMGVGDAHIISEKIEKDIKAEVDGVTDVVVHIEPKAEKH